MKWRCFILFLAVVLAVCSTRHPVETLVIPSESGNIASQNQQLQAVDSLMWRQPDSALMVLVDFAASPKADSLSTFDGHYFQMLLSELLYKNDCEQSNREELLKAVDYFDSLTIVLDDTPQPRSRHCGLDPQSPGQNDNLVFLDARAHYINGVGYYERDSVVEACAEYLKALEVMEEQFEEKDLVGRKAQFLVYIYSRLGDVFSLQFMMESAITCFKNALVFCKIESTSDNGVSNILYRIGKQYDKKGEVDKALSYYSQALENIVDTNNMVFRDIISSKALCNYKIGHSPEQSLFELYFVLKQTTNEIERLNRYLTIGGIYFSEGNYDSALYYLKPVLDDDEAGLRNQAAKFMYLIYDCQGFREQADSVMRFLANHKKSEGESKALTSQLENMFKTYTEQKQAKEAEKKREKSIRKIIGIIVPIAVLLAMAIIIVAKRRSRKLLRQEMEKQRQAHQAQQNALSSRLKQSNQKIRELKEQIKQQDDLSAKAEAAPTFAEEPICRLIVERVNEGQFKAKVDYAIYKDSALDKQQLLDLRLAADRHFNQFTVRLKQAYPKLTNGDLDYCCLYLLGLNDADVSALMQKSYTAVSDRSRKLKTIFGKDNILADSLRQIAES